MRTATPEIGRSKKMGLEGATPTRAGSGRGLGTPAPGEGFALTIAARECAKLVFEHTHDLDDVRVGVALVAAKRASLIGRGPTLSDVRRVLDYFELRAATPVSARVTAPFAGLAHSYAAQRRFVDAVSSEVLLAETVDAPSSSSAAW